MVELPLEIIVPGDELVLTRGSSTMPSLLRTAGPLTRRTLSVERIDADKQACSTVICHRNATQAYACFSTDVGMWPCA